MELIEKLISTAQSPVVVVLLVWLYLERRERVSVLSECKELLTEIFEKLSE